MGTNWSLTAYLPSSLVPNQTTPVLQPCFDLVIDQMSTWNTTSFIHQYNCADPGTVFTPPDAFLTVWKEAVAIANASNGAFNPCLGGLTRSLGFGPETGPALSSALATSWTGDPALQDNGNLLQPGCVELDLSAIAKGFAVDLCAQALEQAGIYSFLMEIGGEYVARGVHPDTSPYWLDIETAAANAPCYRLAACNVAIATSGDLYKRIGDTTHIHAPSFSGYKQAYASSVTVIARTCMQADGWATALYAAGHEGLALADKNNIAALFQKTDGSADVSVALKKYLEED